MIKPVSIENVMSIPDYANQNKNRVGLSDLTP
jgi:hypothetical protein